MVAAHGKPEDIGQNGYSENEQRVGGCRTIRFTSDAAANGAIHAKWSMKTSEPLQLHGLMRTLHPILMLASCAARTWPVGAA